MYELINELKYSEFFKRLKLVIHSKAMYSSAQHPNTYGMRDSVTGNLVQLS